MNEAFIFASIITFIPMGGVQNFFIKRRVLPHQPHNVPEKQLLL